jgi:hypothetical protein
MVLTFYGRRGIPFFYHFQVSRVPSAVTHEFAFSPTFNKNLNNFQNPGDNEEIS